ncbi:hypothetical protein AB0G60_24425 [Streptomyces angustmyceticus]|nr:hypothetical protein [Streptomyces angustmyceticus]UAL66094.1 hypothetical protein K7396_05715 [Streptomyces angustmyceticus]
MALDDWVNLVCGETIWHTENRYALTAPGEVGRYLRGEPLVHCATLVYFRPAAVPGARPRERVRPGEGVAARPARRRGDLGGINYRLMRVR